jgi:signal transduction histidine kinase
VDLIQPIVRVVRRLLAGVRVRVTAAAVLAVACALGVSSAFIGVSLQHYRQHVLMTAADQQAADVADFNPEFALPLILPEPTSPESGYVQVVLDGKVVAASHPLKDMPPLWEPGQPPIQRNDTVLAGLAHDVHVVAVPIRPAGVKATVVVVASLDQYDRSLGYVYRLLEVGMPILLVVVGIICWAIVGRALRPIEALRREVGDVAGVAGTHRVAEPVTNDEVGRLARTLNSMLERLEASSARERRFVSDASHELRSPIANLRTEIEVALHRPERADWPRVGQEVLTQDERMARLVDELLLLARSAEGGLPVPATPVDLAELVESVTDAVPETLPTMAVQTVPAPVAIPPGYLERIVDNLVDNARRYAASRVEVRVGRLDQWAVLQVRDDGPGIPEPERTHIFERFVRLDEARDRGHGGFGLGLAIVADLCRAYGGAIEVGDAGPGAVFTVRLPLSQTPLPERQRGHVTAM